jgi:hypothetical protein
MRVMFFGEMSSGDFFDSLECDRGVPTCQRNSKPIAEYPETVTVDLIGAPSLVSHHPWEKKYPGSAALMMKGLSFQVSWKRELDMRSISPIEVTQREAVNAGGQPVWRYRLTIRSKRVPLTDHLIVVAESPAGFEIARFSGAP